jgi:hypothetical protein
VIVKTQVPNTTTGIPTHNCELAYGCLCDQPSTLIDTNTGYEPHTQQGPATSRRHHKTTRKYHQYYPVIGNRPHTHRPPYKSFVSLSHRYNRTYLDGLPENRPLHHDSAPQNTGAVTTPGCHRASTPTRQLPPPPAYHRPRQSPIGPHYIQRVYICFYKTSDDEISTSNHTA